MSSPFDPEQGLIIVRTELWGPTGSAIVRLALDTGATATIVNIAMLVAVGYDPALAPTRVHVTTGSGVEYVPRVTLSRVQALGQERAILPCSATPCPQAPALTVSWVLISFVARA